MPELKKRETAYKLRIGDILKAKPIFEETSERKRLIFLELGNKQIKRANIIANVIDKYESNEKRFSSITLDDGSGQIKARVFSEDIEKFQDINQGDTIMVMGFLREFNDIIYILPEIVKKKDPRYLLIRKLEIEKSYSVPVKREEVKVLRDQILEMIKKSESQQGIDIEEIIMNIKTQPTIINQEIKKLLEEGIIYEPKPGILRYLG